VTHPEISRYFLNIGEAVSLVIQAGSMTIRGEFLLGNGEQCQDQALGAPVD